MFWVIRVLNKYEELGLKSHGLLVVSTKPYRIGVRNKTVNFSSGWAVLNFLKILGSNVLKC